MFSHGPSEFGRPTIHLAAVGPVMTALAGEIADGLNTHGFTTPSYVREVTLPQLDVGLAGSRRSRGDLEVSVPIMVAMVEEGDDPRLDALRATIAFYGSTPAYRPVLEHHGWGALGDELHTLSKRGEWQNMGALIDDDVLHTFAVVGDARSVGIEIMARYGAMIDRIQLGVDADDHDVGVLIETLRAHAPTA
jgi:probable F420-dependent oxidoreductase